MIKSMTGYGRAAQTIGGREITVEIRSVNNRYLDCSVKLPRVFGFAEDAVKGRVKEEISRGKVDVFISVNVTADAEMKISLNRPVLEGYLAALNTISKDYGVPNDVTVTSLARMPDVVTKGKQWIRLNKNLELLDTPGILWPKFEDQKIGERLALIGSINDEILHVDELAVALIRNLKNSYLDLLEKRYDITIDEDAYDTLKKIAIARKCLQKGELPDVDRASSMLLEDFRSGKLGRITLERPEEWQ